MALAQEMTEQASFSLARNKVNIAHKLRAALASLQNDLSSMKGFEFDPMCHADDGGIGKFLVEEFHHFVLALCVERGCCFVQHDNIRVMQKQPGESEPLLFAARKRLIPGRFFLEFLLKMTKSHLVQSSTNLFESPVFRSRGIGSGAT